MSHSDFFNSVEQVSNHKKYISKHSKIEKKFYSEKNFNLLEGVILDMVNVDQFPSNYKTIIFNNMEKVFKENSPPSKLSRENIKKVLTSLNKEVLSIVAADLNKITVSKLDNKQLNQTPIQNLSQNFMPAPEITLGHPLDQNNNSSTSQFSVFQPSGNNRELKTFYSREFTQPNSTPSLHPIEQLENFTAPHHVDSSNNTTNVMFKKIEQERENENSLRKPKPISFALPENTMDNINPENKFKELMKIREIEDSKLRNNISTPQDSAKYVTKSRIINNDKIEKSSFQPRPNDDSFFMQDIKKPQYDSLIDGLDQKLLISNEIIDTPIEQRNVNINLYKSFNSSEDSFISQQSVESPDSLENKKIQLHVSENSHNIMNDVPVKIENEPKTMYLTISSKYRNKHINPSPTLFSILSTNKKNIIEEKISGQTIFKYNSNDTPGVDLSNIKSILSVECLDVVIPKNKFLQKEPYLWLCINEWGSSNIGTGVPENAFARLKQLPADDNSPFLTMRAHILERQQPNDIEEKLTFQLLTSDGEEIILEDKTEIKSINNNIIKVNDNHEIEKDDLIYIFSEYTKEVIGFYPCVFVHNIKASGKEKNSTLSFRLFVDIEPNYSNNRIGTFADDKEKTSIIAEKYLSVGDLFFMEYNKSEKVSGTYEIVDVKSDIITIRFPQSGRKYTPNKIYRIGFVKKQKEGYSSDNNKNINYKGGVVVKKVDGNNIHISGSYDPNNRYFLIKRKSQISYMFRITYF